MNPSNPKNNGWGINVGDINNLHCDSADLSTSTKDDESQTCSVKTITHGTAPLGKYFQLRYDTTLCTDCHYQINEITDKISAYATSTEVKNALQKLRNVAEVNVKRSSANITTGGYTWTIEFLMDENAFANGNVPMLQAVTNELEGLNNKITVIETQKGNVLRGNFTITIPKFKKTTTPLRWNATAKEVEDAIDALQDVNVTIGQSSRKKKGIGKKPYQWHPTKFQRQNSTRGERFIWKLQTSISKLFFGFNSF